MYENIGAKIKGLATGIFAIEFIGSIVAGILSLDNGDRPLIGLSIIICGPLFAYFSTLVLFAFGELVENISTITNLLQKENNNVTESYVPSVIQVSNSATPDNDNTPETSYCPVCGADVTNDSSFCHVCRAKL
jgi:hypothetical protein